MNIERPDLSQADPAIRAYVEALEAELEKSRQKNDHASPAPIAEPNEPPTTLNVITISRGGLTKRTPRHLYTRQRRGGMGIFDIQLPTDDPPAWLTIADETQDLLLITTKARLFRVPVSQLPEGPVRSRGELLANRLPLAPDEQIALVLPHQQSGYLVTVTQQGHVRRQRHHLFGEHMSAGALLYDVTKLGAPAAACWSSGENDLFIATRQGTAIRFAEQNVPFKGCSGIRVSEGDEVIAVTEVKPTGGVFLLGGDGKGTIRLMAGFNPNKAPGAGGKVALKTDIVIDAVAVNEADDIFIITQQSKIIRFQAAEIPAKEGVVQGVNCITLRADEPAAIAIAKM